MKKIFLLCLVLLGMIACQKENCPRIKLNKDYFPMEIGNQWIYNLVGQDGTIVQDSIVEKDSIVGVTAIDGMEYFKFVNNYGATFYYRKEDDKVYVRSYTIDSKEEMIFDLAANVGDTWRFDKGYVTLRSRNATINIGTTQINGCLEFNLHNKDLIDYEGSYWLVPGIGFVQKSCMECYGVGGLGTVKLGKATIGNMHIEFE